MPYIFCHLTVAGRPPFTATITYCQGSSLIPWKLFSPIIPPTHPQLSLCDGLWVSNLSHSSHKAWRKCFTPWVLLKDQETVCMSLSCMQWSSWGGFVKGCSPSPSYDWQVRLAVHTSDGGGRGTQTLGFLSASPIVAAPHGSFSLSLVWARLPFNVAKTLVFGTGCKSEIRGMWWKVLENVTEVNPCKRLKVQDPSTPLSSHPISSFLKTQTCLICDINSNATAPLHWIKTT